MPKLIATHCNLPEDLKAEIEEFNQGMDEHNEKRVWELLVESAESHSAHRQCTMKNFWHANTWHVVIFFCCCCRVSINKP